MKVSSHSEYGELKEVYLKSANSSFIAQENINSQWETLNYQGQPDFDKSLIEYDGFETLLRNVGVKIRYFDKNDNVGLDSIYCRDASIVTDFGVILCNMGKDGRIHEPSACRKSYKDDGFGILGEIVFPGTLEGGDVAWIDEHTLAVGHTYRTNKSGISQLKSFLEPMGYNVITVDLPHYKGPEDVFHLMSVFSPVDRDLAVVYSPLMPISFRSYLIERRISLIEVPDEEFETMGCNVLAISPRNCIMMEGNPVTKARLETANVKVKTYDGQNISYLGGGGPTCLTRPILREI
jgi:N-dimethylarginine dimethylaminohydrolase